MTKQHSPPRPEVLRALAELAGAADVRSGLRALDEAWTHFAEELDRYRPLVEQLLRRADEVQRLRTLAGRDELTGVANRRSFREVAQRELVRGGRSGQPLSLVMLDLDGLKALNDTFGHAAGDAAIVRAARAFEGQLRGSDVLARLGGDEFAVLLPDTGTDGAQRVAERLREALESEEVEEVALRTSCGVATTGERPSDVDALLAEADAALYREKRVRKSQSPTPPVAHEAA
ncbi:MAG: GGDEF domain-containing protein [Myxococcota bacterium]